MKVQSCCVPSHWLHPAPTASSTGSSNQPPCTPTAKLNSLAEAHQRGKTAFPLAVWLDGTAENNSWVLNTENTEFGPSCHFKREFIDWSDSSQAPAMVQEVCKNINAQKGDRDRFFPLWWFLLWFFKIKTCHWSAGRFFASLHGIPCVQFCYLRISQQRTHTVDTTAGNLQWCKQISHYKKFLHGMCDITVTLKYYI